MVLVPFVVLALCQVGVPSVSGGQPPAPLPELRVTEPGTRIDHSCRVVIAPRTVLTGTDAGALQIVADGVTVEFAEGSVVCGAPADRALDTLSGAGIRIDGHERVVLRGVQISGYKAGIHASHANGLRIEEAFVSGCFAQRLKSSPQAEDAGDWLWPHKNDGGEWLANYGAAVCVEDSSDVTLRNIWVRRAQNGIVLSRVADSRVYDNDCSFVSGWGIAMWRSCGNMISRNAVDFCIRGYSHGVYNRGQDSAGFLVFEQCSKNVFAENSATHSGDAFFGFAGRDALGEAWMEAEKARLLKETGKEPERVEVPGAEAARHLRAGCNDNVLVGNDFSYAAAHGIEMTFSFGNRFERNRIVGNAICGVWGGYSADTLIAGNTFGDNGGAGYGAERGGVNIEHGRNNRVVDNTFTADAVGVRLWATGGEGLARTPWGVANGEPDGLGGRRVPSAGNMVVGNSFLGEATALIVRNSGPTVYAKNTANDVTKEIDSDEASPIVREGAAPGAGPPQQGVLGVSRPVGARFQANGRKNIVMGEWGPWDLETPLVRMGRRDVAAGVNVYEAFGVNGTLRAVKDAGECAVEVVERAADEKGPARSEVRVGAAELGPGVWPYTVHLSGVGGGMLDQRVSGVIVNCSWDVTVFPWTIDPLKDVAGWRGEAKGTGARRATCHGIEWALGYKGPSKMGISPEIDAAGFGANHYGVLARTTLTLRPGSWAVKTLSDDGVRVIADGKTIIERWDIHGPTVDRAVITVEKERSVELVVEYFQNDGFATLSVAVEPADARP